MAVGPRLMNCEVTSTSGRSISAGEFGSDGVGLGLSRSRGPRSRSATTAPGRSRRCRSVRKRVPRASSTPLVCPVSARCPILPRLVAVTAEKKDPQDNPERLTDSGIAIRPSTGPRTCEGWDPADPAGGAGRLPLHPGRPPGHVPLASCGPCASTPASAPPSRPTSASSSSSMPGRPGCPVPSTCPRRWGTTPTTPVPRARWARWGWPSTRWPTCAC